MRILQRNATDEQILAAVAEWTELLVNGDVEAANAFLMHESEAPFWTPALIRDAITNYGSFEPRADRRQFWVTSPRTATGKTPRQEVTRHPTHPGRESNYVAEVWFDLPLNGTWSDVAATFLVKEIDRGLVFELDDIEGPK